jgi:hypothetical protein
VLYQPEGEVRLEVRVENETVWLTQAQMAELFNVQRQAITKHIKNIIETHELEESATSSILELVQKEGQRLVKRPITLYNLDMIISVGFRVNTQRGIKFRRWANQVLKDYMLKGYAVNQRKIATDLQIVDRLHEQRQLIESQEEHGREVENYCFYTLFILYFVVVSTTRLLWRCQFCKSV